MIDRHRFRVEQFFGIDEGLLRAAGKGTIGGFTGVTFDTLMPQTHLLTDFVEAVMEDGITQVGAAARLEKEIGRRNVVHFGDPALTEAVDEDDLELVELTKDTGETVITDQGLLTRPQWEWGRR